MRAILPLLLLCLAATAHAREWSSPIFHCAANVPDSAGWQVIDAPPAPGIAPVLVMQNTSKQTVFGINVIEKYHEANLADPAIQKELEGIMRQFGYQSIGHSNVTAGGITWLQYPVSAGSGPQQVSGLIRYASVGGYVFSITMMRGGGKEASQDIELQQAAASFRVLPAGPVAAATAQSGSANRQPPGPAPVKAGTPASGDEEAATEDNSKARMIWAIAAGLVVLVLFFGIIARKPSR